MADTKPNTDPSERQAAAFIASVLNLGPDPMLRVHSDLLQSLQITMNDWFRRRREALAAAQSLMTGLRSSRDPTETLKLVQEWTLGSMHRLSADLMACHSAVMQSAETTWQWLPREVGSIEVRTPPTAPPADSAGAKPMRMGVRSE